MPGHRTGRGTEGSASDACPSGLAGDAIPSFTAEIAALRSERQSQVSFHRSVYTTGLESTLRGSDDYGTINLPIQSAHEYTIAACQAGSRWWAATFCACGSEMQASLGEGRTL